MKDDICEHGRAARGLDGGCESDDNLCWPISHYPVLWSIHGFMFSFTIYENKLELFEFRFRFRYMHSLPLMFWNLAFSAWLFVDWSVSCKAARFHICQQKFILTTHAINTGWDIISEHISNNLIDHFRKCFLPNFVFKFISRCSVEKIFGDQGQGDQDQVLETYHLGN